MPIFLDFDFDSCVHTQISYGEFNISVCVPFIFGYDGLASRKNNFWASLHRLKMRTSNAKLRIFCEHTTRTVAPRHRQTHESLRQEEAFGEWNANLQKLHTRPVYDVQKNRIASRRNRNQIEKYQRLESSQFRLLRYTKECSKVWRMSVVQQPALSQLIDR